MFLQCLSGFHCHVCWWRDLVSFLLYHDDSGNMLFQLNHSGSCSWQFAFPAHLFWIWQQTIGYSVPPDFFWQIWQLNRHYWEARALFNRNRCQQQQLLLYAISRSSRMRLVCLMFTIKTSNWWNHWNESNRRNLDLDLKLIHNFKKHARKTTWSPRPLHIQQYHWWIKDAVQA